VALEISYSKIKTLGQGGVYCNGKCYWNQ